MHRILSLSLLLLTLLPINRISAQIVFCLGSDSIDYGKDITIDQSGNVIVAGYFYGTVDFDPGSNVHNLTSNGYIDNFVAKYSSEGMYQWAIKYGGSGSDSPNSLKTDSIGNIYICGYYSSETDFDPNTGIASRSSNGGKDIYIAKYDSNGNFMWVNTFGSTNDDEAFDLQLNKAGDIFVTGVFQNTIDVDPGPGTANLISHGGNDIFLVKYTSDGNYLWGFNIGSTGDDEGTAVAVDTTGDCYLSGFFSSTVDFDPGVGVINLVSYGNLDVFIAKYLIDGTLQWADMIGGKGSDQTSFGGIALSSRQDIYITGGFFGVMKIGEGIVDLKSNGSTDVFVVKYSRDGVSRSAFSFGGNGQDRGEKIKIDDYDNIYVVGWFKDTVDFDPGSSQHIVYSHGTNGASDIFVAKYLPNTDFLWVDAFGAATSNPEDLSLASSIALNNQIDFYVTGRFYKTADFDPSDGVLNLVSAGASDIFIAKYGSDGLLGGPANYPIISVTPKNLNFGNVDVDSTRKNYFNVFNTGGQDLVISSVISSNPKFSIASWYSTILPEQVQDFTVSFTPTDSGIHTGWIILNHNALNSKDSISVNGNGVGFVARESLSISSGWNMVSLPLIVGSSSKNILFPTAKSDAFAYNGTGYFIVDSLQTGFGYWLKFDSMQTVRLTGQPLVVDTVWVTSGWNLIGSITFPVETSSIIQEPSANVNSGYFEYLNSYIEATTLVPGRGYWVKVSNDGKLILVAP